MQNGPEPPTKRQKTSCSATVASTVASVEPPARKPPQILDFKFPPVEPIALKEHKRSVDCLVKLLQKKKKIVVIAGAGISVGAGIPDFRSSNGLFSSLRTDMKLKSSGKQLFDASVYKDDQLTSSFHDMVRNLHTMTSNASPTEFHHLLATLANQGRLLRLYSQNVDCIDTQLQPLKTAVPLGNKGPWPRTIQLHGGLENMVCSKCGWLAAFNASLFKGSEPPDCTECMEMDSVRGVAGKRALGVGKLRPRIVLYNEFNPDAEAIGAVTKADLKSRPDCLIVVGTSLKVPGVRRIVREMCGVVQDYRGGMTVWINEDDPPTGKEFEGAFDLIVRGDCEKVAKTASMPRWDGSEAPLRAEFETDSDSCGSFMMDIDSDEPTRNTNNVEVHIPPLTQITQLPSPSISPPPKAKGARKRPPPDTKIGPSAKRAKTKAKSTATGTKAKAEPKKKSNIATAFKVKKAVSVTTVKGTKAKPVARAPRTPKTTSSAATKKMAPSVEIPAKANTITVEIPAMAIISTSPTTPTSANLFGSERSSSIPISSLLN
ncbi:DHS-like NAD/FAD-binding domain-containing protein [Morchella conica CCBAS932]|uniref:DHS-like NAD/FAD-binding domain-containing protein n=1 Tax=Morchella conica CCBAS932 TaxID=1392247 RepID=A0A3N4KZW3_9PEZI|nr:DHS-like NAD/FAD-binding domain-containing protein [Morchella conica CCBAS932]